MKKHLHKGIALLCSAAIAAGMLVGCSSGSSSAAAPGSSSSASASVSNSESGPLFSEPVTLSMLTPSHASWPFQEDWYVVDLIKEYTNVDLKVTAVDTSGFSEKLNLTMASGELPDLMFLTDNTTVQQYAPQGAFINILDHLDKMPNFKAWYEENQQYAANYLSADGGLYQFPQQGVEETERRGWLYRADIFEELGLEMPTNKDEFYDVLVKLKEAYPDSYPLAFRSFAGTMAQMNMIAPSWGTYYLDITDNRYFGYDYGNTILYTVLGTTISLSITAMGAYALSAKRMIGHKFFSMMIVFTMFFQGGMIPTYLVVKSYGLLDTIWGVILPGAVSTWNFIVMRSFFDNYPSEIEESGKVDGLTDAGVFFRLVLPTSKAVLATIGLYYAVSLWNAYFIPFIYLNDPDLFSLQLILHELLSAGSSNNATVGVGDVLVVEESLKYATVLVSIAPIMCVYPFLQKYFVKGVMIGAVKG